MPRGSHESHDAGYFGGEVSFAFRARTAPNHAMNPQTRRSAIFALVLLHVSGCSVLGDGESRPDLYDPSSPATGSRVGTLPGDATGPHRIGVAGAPVTTVSPTTRIVRGTDGVGSGLGAGGVGTSVGTRASGGQGSQSMVGHAGATYGATELARDSAICGDSPWILQRLVRNSRDLGGVPINGGSVVCDRLYRGSHFYSMAPIGCTELTTLGIKTIIDLRTDSERNTYTAPECVSTLSTKFVNAPMPTPYGVDGPAYIADLEQPASLLAIFDVLDDEASYPVYFHCIYGRDRTGVLAALVLRLLGASRDVIMAEYQRSVEGGAGATPSSLEATLDRLDELGGAEAYLLSIGVSAESIAAVRRILTKAG